MEKTLLSAHPRVIYSFGQYLIVICTLGIALLVYWIRSPSVSFTITTQRVRVERGLFSKVQDNLELFRVDLDLESMADTLRECSLRERARRRVLPVEQM